MFNILTKFFLSDICPGEARPRRAEKCSIWPKEKNRRHCALRFGRMIDSGTISILPRKLAPSREAFPVGLKSSQPLSQVSRQADAKFRALPAQGIRSKPLNRRCKAACESPRGHSIRKQSLPNSLRAGNEPRAPTPPPPAPRAPDRSSAPARAIVPPPPASSPCAGRSPRPGRARSCRRRSSGSAGG